MPVRTPTEPLDPTPQGRMRRIVAAIAKASKPSWYELLAPHERSDVDQKIRHSIFIQRLDQARGKEDEQLVIAATRMRLEESIKLCRAKGLHPHPADSSELLRVIRHANEVRSKFGQHVETALKSLTGPDQAVLRKVLKEVRSLLGHGQPFDVIIRGVQLGPAQREQFSKAAGNLLLRLVSLVDEGTAHVLWALFRPKA